MVLGRAITDASRTSGEGSITAPVHKPLMMSVRIVGDECTSPPVGVLNRGDVDINTAGSIHQPVVMTFFPIKTIFI